jgi:hypothetical protein
MVANGTLPHAQKAVGVATEIEKMDSSRPGYPDEIRIDAEKNNPCRIRPRSNSSWAPVRSSWALFRQKATCFSM